MSSYDCKCVYMGVFVRVQLLIFVCLYCASLAYVLRDLFVLCVFNVWFLCILCVLFVFCKFYTKVHALMFKAHNVLCALNTRACARAHKFLWCMFAYVIV